MRLVFLAGLMAGSAIASPCKPRPTTSGVAVTTNMATISSSAWSEATSSTVSRGSTLTFSASDTTATASDTTTPETSLTATETTTEISSITTAEATTTTTEFGTTSEASLISTKTTTAAPDTTTKTTVEVSSITTTEATTTATEFRTTEATTTTTEFSTTSDASLIATTAPSGKTTTEATTTTTEFSTTSEVSLINTKTTAASDTTTTEASPATTKTTMEASSMMTTGATTTTIELSSTSVVPTTTTTSEVGPIETFAITADKHQGELLKAAPLPNNRPGSRAVFDPSSQISPYTLSIEPGTNRIKTTSGSYLCAFYYSSTNHFPAAFITTCTSEDYYNEFIKCTQSNDRQLHCTAQEKACDAKYLALRCIPTGREMSQFMTQQISEGDGLFMAYEPINGYTSVTLAATDAAP